MGWGTDPVFEPPPPVVGGWGRDAVVSGEAVSPRTTPVHDLTDVLLSGTLGRGVRGIVGAPYQLASGVMGLGDAAEQNLRAWDERIRHGKQLTGREEELDIAQPVGGAITSIIPAMRAGAALRATYPIAAKTLPGLIGIGGAEGVVGGALTEVQPDESSSYGAEVLKNVGLGGALGAGGSAILGAGKALVGAVQPLFSGVTKKGRAMAAHEGLVEGLPQGSLDEIVDALHRSLRGQTAGQAVAHIPEATNIVSQEQKVLREPLLAPTASKQMADAARARMGTLEGIAGTDADMASAVAQREAATDKLREAALSSADKTINGGNVLRQLGKLANDPDLRERQLRASVIEDTIERIADRMEKGSLTARDLYGIRQDLGSTIRRLSAETKDSSKALALGAELDIQAVIDNAIVRAGGPQGKLWKQYLDTYHKMSAPINEMEAGVALRDALSSELGSAERGGVYAKALKDLQHLDREGHGVLSRLNMDRAEAVKGQLDALDAYAKATGTSNAELKAGLVTHGPGMVERNVSIWNQIATAMRKGAEEKVAKEIGPKFLEPRKMEAFLRQTPPSMHPLIMDALIRQAQHGTAAAMGASGQRRQ